MDRRRHLLIQGTFFAATVQLAQIGWADDRLAFDELYDGNGILGLKFSDKLRRHDGQRVEMFGFMAPPLKAEAGFFVLTRAPMALCPFCQTDADWPADIVVVLLAEPQPAQPHQQAIRVNGRVEIGPRRDAESGFVSQVRLLDARYGRP